MLCYELCHALLTLIGCTASGAPIPLFLPTDSQFQDFMSFVTVISSVTSFLFDIVNGQIIVRGNLQMQELGPEASDIFFSVKANLMFWKNSWDPVILSTKLLQFPT